MKLGYLLRYRGKHGLYFEKGKGLQLNPYCSSSDGRWLHEPTWFYRLRRRMFAHGGHHRCADRGTTTVGQMAAYGGNKPFPDTWDYGADGNRVCSYCGSIHWDDLLVVCRKALTDPRYSVEGTTKSYKVYVHSPDVKNAGEGAIKFYRWHEPKASSIEDQKLFAAARKLSHDRFLAELAKFNKPRG